MFSFVAGSRSSAWHVVLFALIFSLGCFARVWQFGSVPPGLNQDEASDGVEAISLYRYGTDRNGVSFPIRFISWGSGQDALESYILIPLVALAGLSPRIVRLPYLVSGILTLPSVYVLGRQVQGRVFGLLAMFLLAISPWHIVISRWGPGLNLFPFFFVVGITCLLLSDRGNHWFLAACLVFGIGLYSYITSYLAIPLFLIVAVPSAYLAQRISTRDLVIGVLLFALFATPVVVYLVINTLDLQSLHIGLMTIPHLPSVSRLRTDVAVFEPAPLSQLLLGVEGFVRLVVNQNDAAYNQPGYGYLYNVTFPLVLAGGLLFFFRRDNRTERRLVLAWLLAGISVGVLITPVFAHNNLLFIPLILFCAAFLEWLLNWNRVLFLLSVGAFLAAFVLFTDYYHGPAYKEQADREYYTGLLSALQYAKNSSDNSICVTRPKIIQPYIFVLFSEEMAASVGPDKIVYEDPQAQYREVASVGRYFFGLENCPVGAPVSYVLFFNEPPPIAGKAFTVRQFGLFKVYLAR